MTVVWSVKILVDKKDLLMGDIGATLSIPGIFVIPKVLVRFNAILICKYIPKGDFGYGKFILFWPPDVYFPLFINCVSYGTLFVKCKS